MEHLAAVEGISIELYAKLCALMANTGGDEQKELAIAGEHGVGPAAWKAAKDVWTQRMAHGAPQQGAVVQAFMPHYQAAQAAMRGGAEPMSIEQYARIAAEGAFEKDPDGNKVDIDVILARYGLNRTTWGEVCGYWVPRHNDPAHPEIHRRFAELTQAESDRILGIDRNADDDDDDDGVDDGGQQAPTASAAAEDEGFVGQVLGFFKKLFG